MVYEFRGGSTAFKVSLVSYLNTGDTHRKIALWDSNRETVTIHMTIEETLRLATALLDLVDESKGEAGARDPDF